MEDQRYREMQGGEVASGWNRFLNEAMTREEVEMNSGECR